MSDVKWIQITTDVFDNWKIKQIKAMPEIGHSLVCIWFELLCMTGSCNASGMLLMSNRFVVTDEIIATTFNEDVKLIRLALDTFQRLGMIEITDNDAIQIANWTEYQNEGGLAKIREYERERKAKYRVDKQPCLPQKECPGNVPEMSMDTSISISISNSYSNSISNIISYLNNKNNSNFRSNSKNTIKHIKARLDEGYTEENFYEVIDKKVAEWGNDPKMSLYLRPDTLFGTKFESYLNQKAVAPKIKNDGSATVEDLANKWGVKR